MKPVSGELRSKSAQRPRPRTEPSVIVASVDETPTRRERPERLAKLAESEVVARTAGLRDQMIATQRVPIDELARVIRGAKSAPVMSGNVTAETLTDVQIAAWHWKGGNFADALDASPALAGVANRLGLYYPAPSAQEMREARERIAADIRERGTVTR